MSESFDLQYMEKNLRSQTDFSLGAVYTTNYGLRSLRYLNCNMNIIMNMIPADIRNVSTLSDVILKMKS